MTRRWAFVTAGLAAGFSGLAVIGYILGAGSLLVLEILSVLVAAAVLFAVSRRTPREVTAAVWRVVIVGVVAGAAATLLYDASRTILSVLDPSPYDPFEAIRRFGVGIVGPDASPTLLFASGAVVHYVNGASFGVVYSLFFGHRASTLRSAAIGGAVWGVTLEMIQSILYPGWLQITTVLREFLVISGLGHVVYGLTLGFVVWRLLGRRAVAPEVEEAPLDSANGL